MNTGNMNIGQLQEIEFTAAAIKFMHNGEPVIMKGVRHWMIISAISEAGLTADYKKSHTEGFLVKFNGHEDFVSRDEGKVIAEAKRIQLRSNTLTSEDLW